MFSRAAWSPVATARWAGEAARHRPPLFPPDFWSRNGIRRDLDADSFFAARRARSCFSTARWTAPARPRATDASARVRGEARRAPAQVLRRPPPAAAAAGAPHETAFAAIETDAERAASFETREAETRNRAFFPENATSALILGVRPVLLPASRATARGRPCARAIAVRTRGTTFSYTRDLPPLARAAARVPEGVFRECARGEHRTAANVKNALGVNEHLTGRRRPHRPRARSPTRATAHRPRRRARAEILAERARFLAQPLDDQLGVGLLVQEQRVAHRGRSSAAPTSSFSVNRDARTQDDHGRHHRARRSSAWASESFRSTWSSRCSSRHVRVPVAQRHHHLLQRVRDRLMAVPRTDDYRVMVRPGFEPWAQFEAGPRGFEAPGPATSRSSARLTQTVALDRHREHAVRPAEIFRFIKSTEETGEMDISKASSSSSWRRTTTR